MMILPLTASGNLVKILFLIAAILCAIQLDRSHNPIPLHRWEMFWPKNLEGETLPPTLPAFYLVSSMPIASQCEINYTR